MMICLACAADAAGPALRTPLCRPARLPAQIRLAQLVSRETVLSRTAGKINTIKMLSG